MGISEKRGTGGGDEGVRLALLLLFDSRKLHINFFNTVLIHFVYLQQDIVLRNNNLILLWQMV